MHLAQSATNSQKVTWGSAFRTPPDMPTSIRHTWPLHSQLAPVVCIAFQRFGATRFGSTSLQIHRQQTTLPCHQKCSRMRSCPNEGNTQHVLACPDQQPVQAHCVCYSNMCGTCGVWPMIICRAPVASKVAFSCRQTQKRSYGVNASLLYILFHMTLLASLLMQTQKGQPRHHTRAICAHHDARHDIGRLLTLGQLIQPALHQPVIITPVCTH